MNWNKKWNFSRRATVWWFPHRGVEKESCQRSAHRFEFCCSVPESIESMPILMWNTSWLQIIYLWISLFQMRRIASSIVRGLAEGKQILRQRSLRTPFWRTFFLPEVSRQKPHERSSCTELDVQKATLCISGAIVASSPPFMTLPVQHEHGLHLNVQNLQSENDFLLMTIASWFPADRLEVAFCCHLKQEAQQLQGSASWHMEPEHQRLRALLDQQAVAQRSFDTNEIV